MSTKETSQSLLLSDIMYLQGLEMIEGDKQEVWL